MNKPKRPELKLSELKVPPAVRDVYQDLRDRRLLPLAGLVLVAIIAVPLLLADGAPSEPPPLPPAPEAAVDAGQLEVVKSAPGLRIPSKRLKARQATDPFRQHFTGAAVSSESVTTASNPATSSVSSGESSGSSESSGGSGAVATQPPTVTEPRHGAGSAAGGSPSKGGSGGPEPGPPAGQDGIVYYTFAADLTITKTETTPDGKKVTGEPESRHGVLPSTVLPGGKRQVVTYMGISPKTQKPLVLVSTDVTGVFGDGKCAAGSDSCQLLEMKLTFPETFVYGEHGVRYKINILNVRPVRTDDP
jgi:hypothetical protein